MAVVGHERPSLALREVGMREGAKRLLVPALAGVGAEEDGVGSQQLEVRRLVGARRAPAGACPSPRWTGVPSASPTTGRPDRPRAAHPAGGRSPSGSRGAARSGLREPAPPAGDHDVGLGRQAFGTSRTATGYLPTFVDTRPHARAASPGPPKTADHKTTLR